MRYGIFLSGGGYSGAGQGKSVGTIVQRLGLKPVVIRAVSVGAFTGASLVEHDFDDRPVNDIWVNKVQVCGPNLVFPRTFGALWRFITLRSYIFSDEGLYHLTNLLDINKVCDPNSCRLEVRVFNLLSKKPETHSNHDEDVQRDPELFRAYIRASARLPGIFESEEINGAPYCDAIMGSTIPLFSRHKCDLVFAVVNDPLDYDVSRFISWWVRLRGIPHIVTDTSLEEDRESFGDGLVTIRPDKRIGKLSRMSFMQGRACEVRVVRGKRVVKEKRLVYLGDIATEIEEAGLRTNRVLDSLSL